VSRDAVQLIETTVSDADAPLRVLTLGPLTNIAEALAGDPDLASQIESIYIMGGAVDVPGNIDPGFPGAPPNNATSEWNIYADPAAAQAVLDAGIPVRLICLDGTNQVPVTSSLVAGARSGRASPALGVLAELFDKNDYMTSPTYYLWDTIAAVAAAGYPAFEFTSAHLSVDVAEGPTSGTTSRAEGPPNAEYSTGADATQIERVILSVMGGSEP
jgi:pyrimidine-specific ribonucleoside hydrolase